MCFSPTVALQAMVPAVTGPLVSLSFAARPAEKFLPDFAGLGEVVNATTLSVSFVDHLVVVEAVARVRRAVLMRVREVGVPSRVGRRSRRSRSRAKLKPFVLPRSPALARIVAPVAS